MRLFFKITLKSGLSIKIIVIENKNLAAWHLTSFNKITHCFNFLILNSKYWLSKEYFITIDSTTSFIIMNNVYGF